jgi:hypothetical protein
MKMGTMRFMSRSNDPKSLPKIFSFDSSPGRAIAQALGSGVWNERSYSSVLVESRGSDKIYEVSLSRNPPYDDPSRVMPLEVVGMITHTPTQIAPGR